jgi:hypothetical protein
MRLVRIAGSGFAKTGSVADGHPVESRHWQEVVAEAEAHLEAAVASADEEAVVELWLEDPASFQAAFDEEGATPLRPRTGSMIRHADSFGRKQAVARRSDWDQELSDARAHAASVLSKLGNGR